MPGTRFGLRVIQTNQGQLTVLKVVNNAQMRDLDLAVSKKYRIPMLQLMENAGAGIAHNIIQYFKAKNLKSPAVLIVAGPGNNGGDGIVTARYLLKDLKAVSILLLIVKSKPYHGDAKTNYDIIKKIARADQRLKIIENKINLIKKYKPDIVVDAIFGTGYKGAPSGIYKSAIALINKLPGYKIAVDIPSGVNGDTGEIIGIAVKAHATITMALLKTGHLLYPGKSNCGHIKIANLGADYGSLFKGNTFLLDEKFIKKNLPLRKPDSHKGSFGSVLIVAGGNGYSGAACLTSLAALVSGAGIVRLCYPQNINTAVEKKLTEVIKIPLPATNEGSIALDGYDKIKAIAQDSTVMAIGPGLTTNIETKVLVRKIVLTNNLPLVIDADGLNNITPDVLLKVTKPKRLNIVLTPHPGEFERLFGISAKQVNQNRIEICRDHAQKYGLTIVLKGAPTVIGTPAGKIYVNPTGNSGLAKAGSGDVLTGLIAGFISQGAKPEIASCLGVYLHGLSADIAVEKKTEYSLIASDLIKTMPKAIKEILNIKNQI
ncbi:MAG: NAD(P)H-hydrate dehydratase [Candidatus Latescibacteria bacterium]|nr:NAD(P)H-hydrate dehydratase [Candidatus Latescibacterota bacterium]